jgi:predicted anti-sigma-YlaC factor YlaD
MRDKGFMRKKERKYFLTRSLVMSALLCLSMSGCAVRKMAINMVGDALASSGTTFSSDNDPELVKQALPFSLKLMESLLTETPKHRGLLFATSSAFTQYAYAFVREDADEIESVNLDASVEMKARARRLYLRARDYGLRGLDTRIHGIRKALAEDPVKALKAARRKDVPLMYWTAASWGAAIGLSKNDMMLVADQPIVEALIDRCLELDESFDQGSIHSFLITYETVRQGGAGDPYQRARKHFDRAMELSGGFQAGPLVSLAESVSVAKQDRKEFQSVLERALAIDVNARPEYRLVNLVMQRRAKWLLARIDDLILDPGK